MAGPLSVKSARGSPHFWKAWESPCTKLCAVSTRYHCRWGTMREASSITPSRVGGGRAVAAAPGGVGGGGGAAGREPGAGAVVEVRVPEAVDVLGLVAAHLAR